MEAQAENSPEYLISFLSDFGFKTAFADEADTAFARKAIQLLAELPNPIKELHYIRHEFVWLTDAGRKSIFDVFCRNENQHIFISEMQTGAYEFIFERLFFYVFQAYNIMVKKGKKGFESIRPVLCICILKDEIFPGKAYHHIINLKNQFSQTVFGKISFVIVELGKFAKSANKCKTDVDKLLYTMKNGHEVNLKNNAEVPGFWGEEWLQTVIHKLEKSKLTPEQRMMYEVEWARTVAEKYHYEKEIKEESEKSFKKGEKKATEKLMKKTTLAALQNGMTAKEIASKLDFPLDFVEKVQKKLKKAKI